MEKDSKKEEYCQQFHDFISNEKDRAEEKKLELRLGPPGDWLHEQNASNSKERDESLLSLRYFSKVPQNINPSAGAPQNINPSAGAKRGFLDTVEKEICGSVINSNGNQNQKLSSQKPAHLFPPNWSLPSPSTFQQNPTFLGFQSIQSLPVLAKESSQANGTKVKLQSHETKPANSAAVNNTQTRTASVRVVGWPPIRSFRKNLASSSSKPPPNSHNRDSDVNKEKPDIVKKGLFVKINMDGVPIGRKIDLKAYDSYEKLSCAVDELFRGLLAAQRDSTAAGNQKKAEEILEITGLLDGSGEYTLVYEDNEGDRMLVGDVPWEMFVTSVKRLRVLKSSELSTLRLGSSKQGKTTPDSGVR
ncbi:auxin-responsive protein IAA6-like [Tasmannia lanceolata]|uniref:auxin-responsive protein IAA6-like n=1 Tax=Tasmannia lanceolata TaxID=3420 RepID=UPI0040628A11